jgi:hypothetical protein
MQILREKRSSEFKLPFTELNTPKNEKYYSPHTCSPVIVDELSGTGRQQTLGSGERCPVMWNAARILPVDSFADFIEG